VLIEVAEDGRAQVLPLGKARDDLFDKLVPEAHPITVDLTRKTAAGQLAVVSSSLARQIDTPPGGDGGLRADYFHLDTLPCPGMGPEEEPLDPIALLALFVVPACHAQGIGSRRLDEACATAPR